MISKLTDLVNKYPKDAALGKKFRNFVMVKAGLTDDKKIIKSVDNDFDIILGVSDGDNRYIKSKILTNYFLAKTDYVNFKQGLYPNEEIRKDLTDILSEEHLQIDDELFNEVFGELEYNGVILTPYLISLSVFPDNEHSMGNILAFDLKNLMCLTKTISNELYSTYKSKFEEKYKKS